MQRKYALIGAAFLLTLAGCATVFDGSRQNIAIKTQSAGSPIDAVRCVLRNDYGESRMTTPGTASVHPDYSDLKIQCNKPGFEPKQEIVKAEINAKIIGNVLIGGVIGLGLDFIGGSAYQYPLSILVDMGTTLPSSSMMAAPAKVNTTLLLAPFAGVGDEIRTVELVRRTACQATGRPALQQQDMGVSHYVTHCQDGRTTRTICQQSECRFRAFDD